jgi:protein-disulfide isomerase-like protein with CxxC motif
MNDPASLHKAEYDFARAEQYGVTGFPTLVLLHGTKGYRLSQGYMPFEALRERLDAALAYIQSEHTAPATSKATAIARNT